MHRRLVSATRKPGGAAAAVVVALVGGAGRVELSSTPAGPDNRRWPARARWRNRALKCFYGLFRRSARGVCRRNRICDRISCGPEREKRCSVRACSSGGGLAAPPHGPVNGCGEHRFRRFTKFAVQRLPEPRSRRISWRVRSSYAERGRTGPREAVGLGCADRFLTISNKRYRALTSC